ncbi:site-specific DNA-methyltransferase [Microcystis sp. M034S1]|uniref:DNA-methyltransferase n=1 Tax=Microcystis sp. M034S1 TaxID=2771111 RepID=UPI00258C83D3|nr:site-specific DNA-methyltransferase [Microcystis sp. M034S1]
MQTKLIHSDCLEALKNLPDNSVDSVVTDPPYGLSFMGKKWDYDVPSVEVWAECLRVLKPGGHLLAFAGTRTQHRMAVRIEDVGFEIRDMIAWVYGSGFPKSHNLKDDWKGWGTALKPALEPITVARKPLCGTVAENVLKHGTGALNIDGCRVGRDADDVSGWSQTGSKASENRAMSGGNYARDAKPDAEGRWPANLIHDGGEFLGEQARFFYCAKASKRDRDEGLDAFKPKARPTMGSGIGGQPDQAKPNNRNVHPTVKPTDLMRYLCRLVTPPGGTVLDPFMGSGSTGKAAMLEGFNFIGIEREAEYIEIAKARINWTLLC